MPVVPSRSQNVPEFGRVFLVIDSETEDLGEAIADATARWHDRVWGRYVMKPFTWQRFTNWWVARRWIMPRDVRRR